jgi:hypothetical protein
MKTAFKIIILITIILINKNSIFGQIAIDKYSFNPKLGFYNLAKNDGGFVGGAEINVTRKEYLYSLDYYYYKELVIVFGDSPDEYYNQIGLMIGKYYGEDLFRLQLQGGIAPIWGLRRTDLVKQGGQFFGDTYEHESFFTTGLAIKIGFEFNPLNFLGIGFDLQTNINPKNPVYMLMMCVEIGKIRTKTSKP